MSAQHRLAISAKGSNITCQADRDNRNLRRIRLVDNSESMSTNSFSVTAQLVDVLNERISPVEITVSNGRIAAIRPSTSTPSTFILPGFVDAHVHIESSL